MIYSMAPVFFSTRSLMAGIPPPPIHLLFPNDPEQSTTKSTMERMKERMEEDDYYINIPALDR